MTSLVISVLFFVELLILYSKLVWKVQSESAGKTHIDYTIIRPAAFLFLFGIDLSMSFLPLHMGNLYQPIWGLSKDVVMGLPITTEFIFVGISILSGGLWVDRRGWHEPFLIGLFLAGSGAVFIPGSHRTPFISFCQGPWPERVMAWL